jgi:acetyltransferase
MAIDLHAWERHIALPDGQAVHIRPLRPDDEPLYGPFLKAVTADDVRLRFFGPVKEFSHDFLARFLQIDYAKAMAFIALDEATGAMPVRIIDLNANNFQSFQYITQKRTPNIGDFTSAIVSDR